MNKYQKLALVEVEKEILRLENKLLQLRETRNRILKESGYYDRMMKKGGERNGN